MSIEAHCGLSLPVVLLMLIALAACGTEAETSAPAETDTLETMGPRARTPVDYTVYLQGAISDTLRGAASFGQVVDTQTDAERFVIVLEGQYDLAGGVFLARDDPALPEAGTYSLERRDDDPRTTDGFGLVYRQGLQRYLRATSGTLTLTTVRDTLIEGSFRATLRGQVVRGGERLTDARVDARGTFRAQPDPLGFIIGL